MTSATVLHHTLFHGTRIEKFKSLLFRDFHNALVHSLIVQPTKLQYIHIYIIYIYISTSLTDNDDESEREQLQYYYDR